MKINFWNTKVSFLFIFLFFFLYFIIGLLIYEDYGISIDEPIHRTFGYYWYYWLLKFFSFNYENIILVEKKFLSADPDWVMHLLNGESLWYGPIFDLLTVFLEDKLNITDTKNIYQFRHLINFIFFYLSSVCLFFLLKFRFKNNLLSFTGVIFYVTAPRIFAESFYNPKDIIFMSLSVFCIFYSLKSLENFKILNLLKLSLFCAVATNSSIFSGVYVILSYFTFLIILWPYLWIDTFSNLINAFTAYKNVVGGTNFYLGEYISSKHLPWHYIFVWVGITLPIIYLPLIIYSIFLVIKKFFINFLLIKKNELLFKKKNENYDFFLLIYLLLPIFYFITLNKPLIGGWRYLYFIFPALIYFVIFSIDKIINLKISLFLRNFFFILIFFSIFYNIYILVKLHPFQNIYFNNFVEKKANQLFEVDYWGLANADAINRILKDINQNKSNSIRTLSFTPLHYSAFLINDPLINKIKFSGTVNNNQEYIFTNYVYENNPKLLKKYNLPENYFKFFSFKIGNVLIYDIFKKKL